MFFVYGAFAPPCWALGSPWHLEHHCNRRNGDRKREKLLFHFSLQWDSPLGPLTLENMLIMNMLNKYSCFFPVDKKKGSQCETLIQSHLSRNFTPSSRKENIPFQPTAVLRQVKSGNTEDDKSNSTMDFEDITSSFQCIHAFFM